MSSGGGLRLSTWTVYAKDLHLSCLFPFCVAYLFQVLDRVGVSVRLDPFPEAVLTPCATLVGRIFDAAGRQVRDFFL